ncbi:MAG: hypothetical protein LBH03_05570 [Holophagales bacterium]|jgi:hypothetical protein|nr:hypothetical protein [Holophagales bacterium]
MSKKNIQATYTPLDSLRHILSEYVPSDDHFAQHLSQKLGEIGKNSLLVVGDFLKRPGTSSLRKAVLPVISKHDWPEWSNLLFEILSKEPELAVFDEGCAVLGAIGTKSSWKTLQRLKTVRADRDRQVILNRELNELDARQPLSYYLGRILEGENNPRLAALGARMVSVLASHQDIPAIFDAFQSGDKLAKKQILRILPCFQCPDITDFLLYSIENAAAELINNQTLQETINRLGKMPKPTARHECQTLVTEQFRNKAVSIVSELNAALAEQGVETAHLFDALEEYSDTVTSAFALEALRLLVESKLTRFSVVLNERTDEIEHRLEELSVVLDHTASALERLVKEGGAKSEEVIPHFRKVFNMRLGGNMFLNSYVDLVSYQDTDILDELLADSDYKRRFVILDAFGTKEDDTFINFFLKASHDSIVDVGQRAIQHLGKLRKGQEIFLEYFKSGEPEKMRLALWGFKEIQMQEAADPLLEFINNDLEGGSVNVRNDLLVGAANALASLRIPRATPVLLQLLHDGQQLQLQIAMAEALAALETPDAALGLLSKSKNLRHPEVLIIALQGCLPPFDSFDQPFPMEHFEDFQKLLDRCCDDREGGGQRFSAYCTMEHLYILEITIYEALLQRMSDYLSNMRKGEWDKEANDRLSAIVKIMARRCESLKQLNQKETEITTMMERTAPKGSLRSEALVSVRTKLEDPDLILKAEMARAVASYVQNQLKTEGQEWKDQAILCEIAGLCRQKSLIEPIRVIYNRSTGVGLKNAARNALIKLGFTEADINRRDPISTILVLDPSAFFRKRMVEALKENWDVRDVGTKEEAEKMLTETKADLLLSEYIELEGGLLSWLQSMWEKHMFKYLYICTSRHDLAELGEPSWLIGVMHKPFAMEKLIENLKT